VALPAGSPAPPPRASKCLALLAYLAMEPGQHTRSELCGLLWGERGEAAARASLRQALRQLRAGLGDSLRLDGQTVALAGEVDCDAIEFLRAAERGDPDAAARFDVARFMSGFAVHNAPGFDEWVSSTRQALRRRYVELVRELARRSARAGRWAEAGAWAARWVGSEPLSDDAVFAAAEATYMSRDRGGALGILEEHRSRLEREVGASPSARLLELGKRISAESGPAGAGAREEPRSREPVFHAGLVGRERQWAALLQAWTAVSAGNGRVTLVEGDVGVGKTRLTEEFLRFARAEGAIVLLGRCYDARAGIPYGPVVEALRDALEAPALGGAAPEWLTEVTRLLPELRQRFTGLPEPPAPTDAGERWRLFEGVGQLFLALAAEHPTVIAIDDLQWCDGESCALLHFLAHRLEQTPVALVLALRPGDLERDAPAARLRRSLSARAGAAVVSVDPLTVDEMWAMTREMGRIRAPNGARRFSARLHEVTDGYPFHAIELLKTLFAQGLLDVDEATGEWVARRSGAASEKEPFPMPRTVSDAITERLAQLPYEQRDLLATAAVAGPGCDTALLSHVHGISRLHAAALADTLVERQLLVEDEGEYRCAHPVIAEVVRASLTPSRRREVHRAIALSLVASTPQGRLGEVAGRIARHAEAGGEPLMAYRHAMLACEEAVRSFAFEEALSWLDLAAGAAEGAEQADAVNRRTADVLRLAGWTEPPRRGRRGHTPSRGFAQIDLDLEG
jgi:DNA-binding SARP family transcriptional activator